MAWIAGVDGCKGGWIAVYEDTDSGKLDCRVAVCNRKGKHANCDPSCAFEAVMRHDPPLEVVAVDMPIGLCDDKEGRTCDKAARDILGERRSSIFPAPDLAVLDLYCKMTAERRKEPSAYDCAKKLNKDRTDKGLSRQSWALVPKIAEVDHYLKSPALSRESIHEVHPEVSFTAMNASRGGTTDSICRPETGREMRHPKSTLAGLVERRALLKDFFGARLVELEEKAPECDYGKRAAPDDFYDALACLWTARRIYEGASLTLPCGAPRGTMRIVY